MKNKEIKFKTSTKKQLHSNEGPDDLLYYRYGAEQLSL